MAATAASDWDYALRANGLAAIETTASRLDRLCPAGGRLLTEGVMRSLLTREHALHLGLDPPSDPHCRSNALDVGDLGGELPLPPMHEPRRCPGLFGLPQ